jgi:hypothetical protein
MTESLVSLAEKKTLPLFQRMDKETLEWIKLNKPPCKSKSNKGLPQRSFIERFVPSADWFLERKHIDSIHGMRHVLRVGIQIVLASRELPFEGSVEHLVVAGVLHDIRRENDKADPLHGKRAARWFATNRKSVEKRFGLRFTDRDAEKIYWSILFHELPRSDLKKDKHYAHYRENIDILRVADALDRYRLPKRKWWIDDEILGIATPDRMKQRACDMVIRSEEYFLKGNTSRESVLHLLQ